MKTKLVNICSALVLVFMVSGCVTTQSKQELFPKMYEAERNHQKILIAPIINETTSAEAAEYLNSTLAEPFVNKGYYVLPVPITADIFKDIGIVDGKELQGVPFSRYRDQFGADVVLFITISNWDTNYLVVAGNVEVGLKYVMVSTETSEIVWSYQNNLVVDTSTSSGSLLVDLIATAIATAATDYIPIARQVNEITTQSLPVGEYHPRYGKDMKDNVIQDKATAASDAFVN
ncbi:DUF799 family lipoprotein [Vibrio natriegens]|uniref:GNA1162 family protein n=1 Tax=Vibrio TaxID=662 RepID=UPI000243BC04|nr:MULTISPECIES: GNA1162 family protein [Vibrio]AEX25016.1 lipoprotein [Vibrio sp. EJY3]MCY9876424.1 DUF799 family lipoprotein [Vibrio natriegens]MEE3877352.1 GNA1162 family protein [Vibrio sp. YYF0003]